MAGPRRELAAGLAPTCSAKALSAGSPELPILRLRRGPAGGPELVIFIIASRRLGRTPPPSGPCSQLARLEMANPETAPFVVNAR
jgi:hypothetical protein